MIDKNQLGEAGNPDDYLTNHTEPSAAHGKQRAQKPANDTRKLYQS